MSNRPRPSVLSLFDPLSDAGVDRRVDNVSPDSGSDKENRTPNSKQKPSSNDACSETLFFKRTYSRSKGGKATAGDDIPPVPPLPGAKVHLIDVDDTRCDVTDTEMTMMRKGAAELGNGETKRVPFSEVKSNRFERNVDSLRVAATKNHASLVHKSLQETYGCNDESPTSAPLQDITQDQIVYDVRGDHDDTSAISDDSFTSSQSFTGSPTIKVSLNTLPNCIDPPSPLPSPVSVVPSSEFNSIPSLSSRFDSAPSPAQLPSVQSHPLPQEENSSPLHTSRFEDHPPSQDFGIRRLSTDSHKSFSFKRADASTDLVNDEMSFMMNLDQNSFLDHSRLGIESSRIQAPSWECDTTPQRARIATASHDNDDKNAMKADVNNSVFSPPTMTSTPPIASLGIVEQVIREDDEEAEVQNSKFDSPPSTAEDSGASGESNETITPSSSPIPATVAAAPTKKNGGIKLSSRRLHTRSDSVPVNNVTTQPLAIKKKVTVGSSLARSNSTTSTTSTLLRRRSSLKPMTTPVVASKDTNESFTTARGGGARRVPMTEDAPLLPSKAKHEISATRAAAGSKGPQRPSISGIAPSVEPRIGFGGGVRNPIARISTSAPKPRPLSLQLPSAFSVSAVVPPSVTKIRSSIVAPAVSASKLPQPQSRSRIPGPTSRSVSGLRKAT